MVLAIILVGVGGVALIPSAQVVPMQVAAIEQQDDCKVVKRGDTLTKLFGKGRVKLATINGVKLKNPNLIRVGQYICVPKAKAGETQAAKPAKAKAKPTKLKKANVAKAAQAPQAKQTVKPAKAKPVKSAKASAEFRWTKVGGAPLNGCGGKNTAVISEEAWTRLGLTEEEKFELRSKMASKEFRLQNLTVGQRFPSVAFCQKGQVTFRQNVVTAWSQGEVVWAEMYVLASGRKLLRVRNCGNWVLDTPEAPVPVVTPPVVVEPPKAEPPLVEPPKAEPPPEEDIVFPVHAKEGDSIPCNLIAGAGVYGSRVYKGAWGYGEGICYIFKSGEWQHGPGFYAMGGGGESSLSSYKNKETGIGLQYGVQRNFINDRGHKSTLEVKARWLADRMWGSNPESGYSVNQKGQKFGLYGSYYERHGDNLVGGIAEYWKSFGAKVKSSWSEQPAQDRGSLGIYGVYEHKLGKGEDWRLRWIAGAQHTNWDSQNWFRFIPEFRYKEWLMFGPQFALPIGVSHANQPMRASDIANVGAFIRAEFGGEIRKADAKQREEQLEFVPAHGNNEADKLAGEVTEQPQSQLEFVPITEAAKPPD